MSTTKRITKRLIAVILTVLMLMSMVTIGMTSASAAYTDLAETGVTLTGGEVLYLKPGVWTADNARFAAYFCNGTSATTWVNMTDPDGDGQYEVTVPANSNHKNVIFCRMNPSATANNWTNKWDQTSDLTYDGSKSLYTITGWGSNGKSTGSWGVYTPAAPIEYYVRGSFNGWVADDTNKMTRNDDGSYTYTTTLEAGSYEYKIAQSDWSQTAYPSNNKTFKVTNTSTVTFTLSSSNSVSEKIEAIPAVAPEMPTNVTITAIGANGTGTEADPFVAKSGTAVQFSINPEGVANGYEYTLNNDTTKIAISEVIDDTAPDAGEVTTYTVNVYAYNTNGVEKAYSDPYTVTFALKGEEEVVVVPDGTPFEADGWFIKDGLYAYAGTEVKGTNAWQRWDEVSTGNRAFYLPASVTGNEVAVYNTYEATIVVNGIKISPSCYNIVPFVAGETYTCSGANDQTVTFYVSDAEGTIFTNTKVGMVTVDDNKDEEGNPINTETTIDDAGYDIYKFLIGNTKNRTVEGAGGAVASAANGVTDGSYVDDEGETVTPAGIKKIKGRGNSTWNLAKRPFNITFNENIEIDGMKGKKWSLLANAQDPSLIRNRLVYDMANEVDMAYACDSRFVDWFVNGEYKGSYQLTQKIEMGKNTVMSNLKEPEVEDKTADDGTVTPYPKENFDFVLELDTQANADNAGDLTFTTELGQVMTHKIPDEPKPEQVAFMKAKYQAVEDALYGKAATDTEEAVAPDLAKLAELVDINDFAKAYLVNEVAKNLDSGVTSCYFVYDSANDIFRMSPVWDYDNALGNSHSIGGRADANGTMLDLSRPDGWYVKDLMHYDLKGCLNVFGQALTLEGFDAIVKETFNTEFLPLVDILNGEVESDADHGRLNDVDDYLANLSESAEWNYKLWELCYNGNSNNNTWIADHKALAMYTYDADANALTYKNKNYDQTTFQGQADYAADWMLSRINWMAAQFSEADLVVPEGYITVYFSNNWNFDTVNIHYWNDTTGEGTSWPGERMIFSNVDANTKETVMCAVIPADTEGIVFTGINDEDHKTLRQTVDIKSGIINNAGFYCDSESGGKINVKTYTYVDPDVPVVNYRDIYLQVNGWAEEGATYFVKVIVEATAEDENTPAVAAEGDDEWTAMTELANDAGIYTAEIDETATSLVFKKSVPGEGEAAAVESTFTVGVNPDSDLYTINSVDEDGTVDGTWGTYTAPVPEPITVYFQNNWLWTDVCMYSYSETVEYFEPWPGAKMELYGNDGTYDIYKVEVPGEATKMIFNGIKNDNSNERNQSPEITEIVENRCYYMKWENESNQVGYEDINVILPPVVDKTKIYFDDKGIWNLDETSNVTVSYIFNGESATVTMTAVPGGFTAEVPADVEFLTFGTTVTGEDDTPTAHSITASVEEGKDLAYLEYITDDAGEPTDEIKVVWDTYVEPIEPVDRTIYLAINGVWEGSAPAVVYNGETITLTAVEGEEEIYTATIKYVEGIEDIMFIYSVDNADDNVPTVLEPEKDLFTLELEELEGTPVTSGTWSVYGESPIIPPDMPTVVTVNVINSAAWEKVYAYIWEDDKPVAWPGTEMEKTDETVNGFDVYSLSFDSSYTNIIFNNNDNGQQTDDLTVTDGYYYDVKSKDWYATLEDVPPLNPLATGNYLAGNFVDEWKTQNEFMLEAEGDRVGYVTLELDAGEYEFKIVRQGTWASCKDVTAITETTNNITVSSSASDNCILTVTEPGTYTFAFAGSDSLLAITYPGDEIVIPDSKEVDNNYYIHGEFNGWEDIMLEGEDTVLTAEVVVPNGTHGFKITQNDKWYGNSGTFTDETNGGWTFSEKDDEGNDKPNCTMIATGGTYLFSLDTTDMKLTVTIIELDPPTYAVIYNEGEFAFGGDATATFDEAYSFTVTPNEGYVVAAVIYDMKALEAVDGVYTIAEVKGDIELYIVAAFEPATTPNTKFTVIFLKDDGSIYSVRKEVPYGTLHPLPPAPYKEGYIFKGWTPEVEIVKENGQDCIEITSDYVFSPVFEEDSNDLPVITPPTEAPVVPETKTYTVIFLDNDNKFLGLDVVEEGKAATAPEIKDRPGYTFEGWDKDFTNVTENMTVIGTFKKIPVTPPPAAEYGKLQIEVAGGTGFTISIDGGNVRPQGTSYYNAKAPINKTVTVVANASSDNEFIGWMDRNQLIVSKDLELTFVTSGDDFYKAMYKNDIENASLVMFMNNISNQLIDLQYYTANDDIVLADPVIHVMFTFNYWTFDGETEITADDIKAKVANGESVTVIPNWTKILVYLDVDVINGTVKDGASTNTNGDYERLKPMTVIANAAPAGQKFAYWAQVDADGNEIKTKSYQTTYTLYPAEDMILKAVYVNEAEEIDYQVLTDINMDTSSNDPNTNTIIATWEVPESKTGYDFIQAGVLAANADNYKPETFYKGTPDGNVLKWLPPTNFQTATSTVTVNKNGVYSGETWVLQLWVTYNDGTKDVTVYSDLVYAIK